MNICVCCSIHVFLSFFFLFSIAKYLFEWQMLNGTHVPNDHYLPLNDFHLRMFHFNSVSVRIFFTYNSHEILSARTNARKITVMKLQFLSSCVECFPSEKEEEEKNKPRNGKFSVESLRIYLTCLAIYQTLCRFIATHSTNLCAFSAVQITAVIQLVSTVFSSVQVKRIHLYLVYLIHSSNKMMLFKHSSKLFWVFSSL